MDQQPFASQRFAVPTRFGVGIDQNLVGAVPPFIVLPASLEVAASQQRHGDVPMRQRRLGIDSQRLLQAGDRSFGLSPPAQHLPQVDQRRN